MQTSPHCVARLLEQEGTNPSRVGCAEEGYSNRLARETDSSGPLRFERLSTGCAKNSWSRDLSQRRTAWRRPCEDFQQSQGGLRSPHSRPVRSVRSIGAGKDRPGDSPSDSIHGIVGPSRLLLYRVHGVEVWTPFDNLEVDRHVSRRLLERWRNYVGVF